MTRNTSNMSKLQAQYRRRSFNYIKQKMKQVNKRVKHSPLFNQVAKEIAKEMRNRVVINGEGVSGHLEPAQKLKPLSQKYIERRKHLRKTDRKNRRERKDTAPKLARWTTPAKSNLTFSGELIKSITGIAFKGKIIIKMKPRASTRKTNYQIAQYVEDAGRPFFYISDIEFKSVQNKVRIAVLKIFDKIFKTN